MRYQRLAPLALTVALMGGMMTTCTVPPSGKTPVVFVHGYLMEPWNWQATIAQFKAAGYSDADLFATDYDYTFFVKDSAPTLARDVDALLARTGAAKVDIVSHSLGSFVTKQCIILDGCANKVSHWMSLAGVDNGTEVELVAPWDYVRSNEDVQGRTTAIKDLQDRWCHLVNQGVQVEVQWTPNDLIVRPPNRSEEPAPAVNKPVNSLDHISITVDPPVVAETIRFFNS